MKRAFKIARLISYSAIFLAAALLLSVLVWWLKVPRHQGIPIHQWFTAASRFNPDRVAQKESTAAFQAMREKAVPFLLKELDRKENPDRIAWYLKSRFLQRLAIDPRTPNAVRQILRPPPGDDRYTAFSILRSLQLKDDLTRRRLETLLSSERSSYYALQLISAMGSEATNSAPAIAQCLLSESELTRRVALTLFAKITPAESPLLETLRTAIRDGKIRAGHGFRVLDALRGDYSDLLPVLGEELCSTNGAIHLDALATCDNLGLAREVLLPRINQALQDPDPRYRAALLQRVRSLGDPGAIAISAIIPMLDAEHYYLRAEAARTLGAIGPSAEAALEKLRALEQDPNDEVAAAATEALLMIERER